MHSKTICFFCSLLIKPHTHSHLCQYSLFLGHLDQAYAAMFILWYYVLCIFLLYSSILIHLIFKHYKSLDNPWDFVLQITVCLKLRVEINYAPWSGLYLKKVRQRLMSLLQKNTNSFLFLFLSNLFRYKTWPGSIIDFNP